MRDVVYLENVATPEDLCFAKSVFGNGSRAYRVPDLKRDVVTWRHCRVRSLAKTLACLVEGLRARRLVKLLRCKTRARMWDTVVL